ncbi:hypothetical protein JZX86_27660 [Agrobacterium rosae]|uniref:hypothetical protein n=1 Tax=Agrobacterium rosae TaxID=1972867 RepID=UPI0019D37B3F|nr:hypothetical protein [Agrobacterium rosae]MBN7809100.1 hypothetical protein [Agrobacterium rosae]
MSTPLKNVPIEWETPAEHDMVHNALTLIGFEKSMWRQVKRNNETRSVLTRLGGFSVTYHTFERALEVTHHDDTFRFVYGRGFIRIDGDKAALKRWLFIHKLTA